MCEAIKFYCKICKQLWHQQGPVEYNHCQKPECTELNYIDYYRGYCNACDYVIYVIKLKKIKKTYKLCV